MANYVVSSTHGQEPTNMSLVASSASRKERTQGGDRRAGHEAQAQTPSSTWPVWAGSRGPQLPGPLAAASRPLHLGSLRHPRPTQRHSSCRLLNAFGRRLLQPPGGGPPALAWIPGSLSVSRAGSAFSRPVLSHRASHCGQGTPADVGVQYAKHAHSHPSAASAEQCDSWGRGFGGVCQMAHAAAS